MDEGMGFGGETDGLGNEWAPDQTGLEMHIITIVLMGIGILISKHANYNSASPLPDHSDDSSSGDPAGGTCTYGRDVWHRANRSGTGCAGNR